MFTRPSRRFCALNLNATKIRIPQTSYRSFFSHTRPCPRNNQSYHRPSTPQILVSYPRTHSRSITYTERVRLTFREASKGIWRKNPILLPLAILSVITASALFTYIIYVQVTRINPQYHNFPPKVAKALRKALYYTEIDLNPHKALASYKDALRQAVAEEGMHPYSDEVLGIRLQVAAMLEKAGLIKPAVKVLEQTKQDALAWVEEGRRKKALSDRETRGKTEDKLGAAHPDVQEMLQKEDWEERQRDKALKKVIGIELELAQLYFSDHMQDPKKAEAAQVAAVELCLKEMRRRQSLGLPAVVSSDDNTWLSLTEVASAMTDLAQTYFDQDKTQLAVPLFMQALALIRQEEGTSPTCKQVVLLGNIASSMFYHNRLPPTSEEVDRKSAAGDPSLKQIEDAAAQWAQKTLEVAARVDPPVRDQDCDASCATVSWQLGRMAQVARKWDEAKQRYLESKKFAEAAGDRYEGGVGMADEALQLLEEDRRDGK
jgi:tetratricopeptide (TPR) repeat protein